MAVLNGMDQLLAAIRQAPQALQQDAEAAAREAADSTAGRIRAVYQAHRSPNDTYVASGGRRRARRHLADNVIVSRRVAPGYAAYRVLVDAPHAHLFEQGTDQRNWKTRSGKSTGKMERKGILLDVAPRERDQMVQQLVVSVRELGFEVKL